MNRSRLEAFSDGVLAIIITIMVLELKIPKDTSINALKELLPTFSSYLMSFVFVGIYWGNHHHLVHTVKHVNGKIMSANMVLLFFLSLVPFSTGWMGENHYAELPVAFYAVNLFFCGIAFYILQRVIMLDHTDNPALIAALQKQDKKGIACLLIYLTSIAFAFYIPLVSAILFSSVSLIWLIPDKNIEKALTDKKN